ncbi:serine/threonine protein phosphatase 2A 57 kDa regulatory subunit B' beta isoform-like [Zingiber officinale]|uniref:serine/threonine protein phosphatase 2A 57 kDa regulatory subunit B' beta isoform-like n=1 Tax=Zingiber officinale TaxID=94328 RepID=UPI001C4C8101|nr:serine/threonine protein phosphatase 2A 57 kDa regulatory subunit B' beta isoform-like [Zingiber officinale]
MNQNSGADHAPQALSFGSRSSDADPGSPRQLHSSPAPGAVPQIKSLPLFRDVPVLELQALFLRKLQICSVLFDFSDTLKSAHEKEVKRQTLSELVDFVQSRSSRLNEQVQEELVCTVDVNIFRSLPPASHENTGVEPTDPEEEDPYLDPAWPHLQLVYELLLLYVVSSDTDTKVAKSYIDHSFVLRLLDLLNSEDL